LLEWSSINTTADTRMQQVFTNDSFQTVDGGAEVSAGSGNETD
jgi:hypothetical protein